MKILAAGDLHFNKEKYETLADMSFDCDVLCLTGDYLDDSRGNRDKQIDWVSSWIADIKIPVVMCSGNHDLDELAECEWIDKLSSSSIITDNSVWTYNGITFGVIPYIGAQYEKFADCEIIVSHLPPSKTKISMQDGEDFGDDELFYSIVNESIRPTHVICGHVEEPEAIMDKLKKVKIVNVSTKFLILDI